MDPTFLNIIVLLGAVQGLTLCFFLHKQRKANPLAFIFFILFLFSLAFFNLMYAFLYMKVYKIGFLSLTAFPLPYKYLIGVGFYFYIKHHLITTDQKPYYRKEIYLFAPAILYGLLRLYWYIIALIEDSPRVMLAVFETGFFTYNEFAYLLFDLCLTLMALRFLKRNIPLLDISGRKQQNWQWLRQYSYVFLGFTLFNLFMQIVDVLFNPQELILFYYPILLVNSAFIYWLGYIGFSNPGILFSSFHPKKDASLTKTTSPIYAKLKQAIEVEEVFKNPSLSVSELAVQLHLAAKDLSQYINEVHQMNFSEFMNYHRVEKVKTLMQSEAHAKYTLFAIAQEAGFVSKSSFNAAFKKATGLTPSAYKKGH